MLNNSYAPSKSEILRNTQQMFGISGEESVLRYLSELASYEYKCPDKCDQWACDFYEEYKEEIEDAL